MDSITKVKVKDTLYEIEDNTARTETFSGNYNDLKGTPAIPSKLSDLTNDKSFITNEELAGAIQENIVATEITYNNVALTNVTSIASALDVITEKLFYVDPSISSFAMTPSTTSYEIGTIISSLTFKWTLNKDIVSQSLTGLTLLPEDRTATYTTAFSSNKTFTLSVNDGTKSVSKSLTVSFLPRIHYGVSTLQDSYGDDFILNLGSNKLASTKSGTYKYTASVGEYGFLAYPAAYGVANCKIGGFDTELDLVGTISHTNAKGYKQNYYLYKTTQANLGSFDMVIS